MAGHVIQDTTTTQQLNSQITLATSGLVYFKDRPRLELSRVTGVSKPTIVYQGMVRGFSLPVYNSDNEELFFDLPSVPERWDGTSDPVVYVQGYLDTANTSKKFKLQVDWYFFTPGSETVTGGAVIDTGAVYETTTGTWAQYYGFETPIPLNYDTATPNNLTASDFLMLRLYRIAASSNEIAGEVVITGLAIKWRMNKFLYAST